jgi:hypothetical protein
MSDNSDSFGSTATKLSQNPLGIIALFIVLVYGFASLVLAVGRNLDTGAATPLVWFLVCFPVLVLATFAWLVSHHHTKLYAPKDFQDESLFFRVLERSAIADLPKVDSQQSPVAIPASLLKASEGPKSSDPATPEARAEDRQRFYDESRKLVLVHVLSPSRQRGQLFDVYIYLKRHKDEAIDDVLTAEFFFGRSWGNRVFVGQREGNLIGVATSAYGPFLCSCRVVLRDGSEIMLYRYIDFEMGDLVRKALAR